MVPPLDPPLEFFYHEPYSVRSGNFVYIKIIKLVHDISTSFKLT